MIKHLMWFSIILLLGCSALSHDAKFAKNRALWLDDAQASLEAQEYFRARQLTQKILDKNPNDADAQKLMAVILEKEIARQMEAFEPKAEEEFSEQEKNSEAKTWLERSRALLGQGKFDEAVAAAEKVFSYDPQNQAASELIDAIRSQALREGKSQELLESQLAQEEIHGRIERYRSQAKAWIQSGHWGAARLTVQKILLLAPGDQEAIGLYKQIEAHQNREPA